MTRDFQSHSGRGLVQLILSAVLTALGVVRYSIFTRRETEERTLFVGLQ